MNPAGCFTCGERRQPTPPAARPALEALPPNVAYRQVILGFQIEGERSRWLTHGEISQGVLQAIADDAEYHVVGVVRPWERRPWTPGSCVRARKRVDLGQTR